MLQIQPLRLPQLTPPTFKPLVLVPPPPTEVKDAVELSQPVKLKEATGDMALMVESMQAAEERMQLAGNDVQQGIVQDIWANRSTGKCPIAMLDWGAAPSEFSPNIDGFLAILVAKDVKKTEPPKENHHLLGGHLGIEGGEHIAHEVMNIKAHTMAAVTDSKDAIDLTLSGGNQVAKHGAQQAAEAVVEHGHALSGWMAGVTSALAAGSGVLGAIMLHVGIKGIQHGIKHKNAEHTIEGVNNTLVGTRSLAAATSMTGHLLQGSEVITTIAGVAKSVLTPLGIVHGAIDTGLGAKQIYDGVKSKDGHKITKGSLGVGLGVSLMVAAVGGGIPAIVAAGVFLGGKVVHGIHQRRSLEKAQAA